jgi:4-hydroxy-tetrahydrodipicolinate reductase
MSKAGPLRAKPRIAIYGVGQYGLEAARIILGKGWPIVAAVNRAGAKIGKDIGRLAGLNRDIDVIVQDCATANFGSFGADVAIVALTDRLKQNLPAYRSLMDAGINVICHGAEAYFPQGADPELAQQIDAIARRNDVTFTGTGIWDFSRIWAGILAAGPCTEIRSFFHRSVTDAESANITLMRVCGVSMTQEEYAGKNMAMIGGLYKLIPHHVLHALGYTITRVTERREPVLSNEPVYCRLLDRDLEPGICIGTRIVADVQTEEGVSASTHIELRILPQGETEHMVWSIDGKPASKVRVDRTDAVHTSAACMVNRAPDVIAAPPGIQLVSQLGPLKPKFQ